MSNSDAAGRRVIVDQPLPAEDALELRDHLRDKAEEIGVRPEVIQVE